LTQHLISKSTAIIIVVETDLYVVLIVNYTRTVPSCHVGVLLWHLVVQVDVLRRSQFTL